MKGFRFRLDSVRKLRAAELEARRVELERARKRSEAERSAADAAADRVRSADAALVRSLGSGIGGEALRSALEAREMLRRAADQAGRNAQEAVASEDAARQSVLDAWRRLRSLEMLRSQAFDLWRRDEMRREQKDSDELAGRSRQGTRTLLVAAALVVFAAGATQARSAEPVAPKSDQATAVAVGGDDVSVEALRRILSELKVRDQALDRRERDVAQRERVADDLAADTAKLLTEIEAVRTELDARIGSSDAAGAARIGRLAKTYSEMAASRAAPLLEDLDPDLATAIVSKMKPKKSAAVLSQMSKAHALRMSQLAANPLDGKAAAAATARKP